MRVLSLSAALLASAATAQLAPPARDAPSGLVIATSPQLASTLRSVAAAFKRDHPRITITIRTPGSDVAMAALYAHRADLAVIGREASDSETKAFEWIYRRPPDHWTIMRGSLETPGRSPAVGVLVNVANPIRSITLAQLRDAFCADASPSWSDLGVVGAKARPVHPIVPNTEQGTGRFLRRTIFANATLFAWQRVREVTEPLQRDDGPARIAAIVAKDPDALALTGGHLVPGTRRVPILVDGKEVPLSATMIASGRYPLVRTVYAYGNRPTDEARMFLSFILGAKGRAVVAQGPYIPFDTAVAESELRALDEPIP